MLTAWVTQGAKRKSELGRSKQETERQFSFIMCNGMVITASPCTQKHAAPCMVRSRWRLNFPRLFWVPSMYPFPNLTHTGHHTDVCLHSATANCFGLGCKVVAFSASISLKSNFLNCCHFWFDSVHYRIFFLLLLLIFLSFYYIMFIDSFNFFFKAALKSLVEENVGYTF